MITGYFQNSFGYELRISKILNIEKLVVHFDSFTSLQLTTSQNSKISLRFLSKLSSKSLEKLSSAKYFLSPGVVFFLSLSIALK